MSGRSGSGSELTVFDVVTVCRVVSKDSWLVHDVVSGYCTNCGNAVELPTGMLYFKTPEAMLLEKERRERIVNITHHADAAEIVGAILSEDRHEFRSPKKGNVTLTAVAKHFRRKWGRKRTRQALEEIRRILADLE